MIVALKTFLTTNALRVSAWCMAALSFLGILLAARRAGRNAERVGNLEKTVEIKDAQLRATLDAPRSRDELAQRLRDGKF